MILEYPGIYFLWIEMYVVIGVYILVYSSSFGLAVCAVVVFGVTQDLPKAPTLVLVYLKNYCANRRCCLLKTRG